MSPGILHALYSLRAEGCPRLAYDLLTQGIHQDGQQGSVTVLEHQPDLQEEFQKLQIPIHQLIWKRRNYLSIYRQFLDVLNQEQPRGVVLYPLGAHIPMSWACRKLDIPHVVHLACLPPRDKVALGKLRLQMWTGQLSTAGYAACSERVRVESIFAYRLPKQMVKTIYNGINVEAYARLRSMRQPWNEASNRPLIVGMTGSLEVSKDYPTLIRAVALLHQSGKDVRLRIVGGGSQDLALKALAVETGIGSIIDWTGSVKDVQAELARMDVFAFSAKPEEGLGIALIEAMASGLPLLATDIPAVGEIFKEYPEGVVVPFGDVSAMAEGIWRAAHRLPASLDALKRFSAADTYRQYSSMLDEQAK